MTDYPLIHIHLSDSQKLAASDFCDLFEWFSLEDEGV